MWKSHCRQKAVSPESRTESRETINGLRLTEARQYPDLKQTGRSWQKEQNGFMKRWMDNLGFHVLFNSISVITGRWADYDERLYTMKPCLRLKSSPPKAGSEPGTARSVGQCLTDV